MAQLLLLSSAAESDPLPSLELLSHQILQIPLNTSMLLSSPESDLILIDARRDLANAKAVCKTLGASAIDTPVILIVTEGGCAVVNGDWSIADMILDTAGPAEIEARLRLALDKTVTEAPSHRIHASGVTIDEANYSAKVKGKALDLTYKEFELLRFFASNPSRVFTREHLLSEVWGYDYFGGTRTVDVHVRRLRAKLGDLEQLIGTVRNVGYRFNIADEKTPEQNGAEETAEDSK